MENIFVTERLKVRKFKPSDKNNLAEILTDPEVTWKKKCLKKEFRN